MDPKQLKVKKSHDLVTARHSFSLMEMRLFTLLVSLVDDRDEDFRVYKIPVKDFINTFGLKSKTVYAEVSQLTTSLIKKVIVIPLREDEKDKELKITLVNSFLYNKDWSGVVEATFHPAMKPYLLQLKNKFLLYDLKNILKISSWNSIRMYELLKSFEGIGKRVFDIEELKQILWVDDKYTKYANFKKRILLKAQEDLSEHTDICFTFEELSEGSRRVEKIAFHIRKNVPDEKMKSQAGELSKKAADNIPEHSWLDEIRAFGVSEEVLQSTVIWQYEDSFILETLKHCKKYFKAKQVDQKAGFFLQALQKWYYKDEIQTGESKKQKQSQTIQQEVDTKLEEEQKKIEQEKLLIKLREEYMTPEFIQSVLADYEGNFLHPIMEKDLKEGKINKWLQVYIDRKLLSEFWWV